MILGNDTGLPFIAIGLLDKRVVMKMMIVMLKPALALIELGTSSLLVRFSNHLTIRSAAHLVIRLKYFSLAIPGTIF